MSRDSFVGKWWTRPARVTPESAAICTRLALRKPSALNAAKAVRTIRARRARPFA